MSPAFLCDFCETLAHFAVKQLIMAAKRQMSLPAKAAKKGRKGRKDCPACLSDRSWGILDVY
jgi:hypothetical protein